MLAEWVRLNLTTADYRVHPRISGPNWIRDYGALDNPGARALVSTWPEADLIVRWPGRVEVVEFIVHRPQETVGQMLYYLFLLPGSVGYEDVLPDEVSGRIVSGLEAPHFREFVAFLGLAFELYQPPWLLEAIAKRRGGTSPE